MLVDVDFFVLDRTPQAFDKDVVKTATAPIHADMDPSVQQLPSKGKRCELTALVAVEDERLSKAKRLLKRIKAKSGFH